MFVVRYKRVGKIIHFQNEKNKEKETESKLSADSSNFTV